MQMIEALDRGVHGFMPTAMHEIYTRIYSLYTQGDRPAAQALFERLLPVLAFSNQHLDISIHFFKRLLHAEGIYTTPRTRSPILSFDATHEALTANLIRRVGEITASLG
jgi:4-hydroxy-tetrahydrodipicolinate synthase